LGNRQPRLFDLKTLGEGGGQLANRSIMMMKECLTELTKEGTGHTIFVHNMGKFDGYFLLKPLVEMFGSDI